MVIEDRLLITLLPIVIRIDERAILIVQLQNGILHRVLNASQTERWTERSRYDDVHSAVSATQNRPADEQVIAQVDKSSRAHIGKPCVSILIEIVDLQKNNSRAAGGAARDRRISTGRQRSYNRGFAIIGRCKVRRHDLDLLRIFPIVVCRDDRAGVVVQFDGRIRQRIGHAVCCERWTERADDQVL